MADVREFKTPDPGEGIHEVEIVELFVSEGDEVNEGDALMGVESDKATILRRVILRRVILRRDILRAGILPASGPQARRRHALPRRGRRCLAGHPTLARELEIALPDFARWGEVSREPLRGVRRAAARRMSRSWREIPHVSHTRLADVTALEAFRRKHVGDLDAKLTLTVLVVKALAGALRRFPRFNASLDPAADETVYKHYCHIGVAVSTDRGLLVPVLRDADRRTLRARSGKLSADDMRGGTLSVTNVGGVGGDHFTPIINYPEAAILGMGALREVPVLVRDAGDSEPRVEGRLQLPLILAFDHRLNDGMDAAGFVNAVAEPLADPELMLLDT